MSVDGVCVSLTYSWIGTSLIILLPICHLRRSGTGKSGIKYERILLYRSITSLSPSLQPEIVRFTTDPDRMLADNVLSQDQCDRLLELTKVHTCISSLAT